MLSKLNRDNVKWKIRQIITSVYYKRVMGLIGESCTICKPLHIIHPECIFCGNHVRFREFARVEAVVEYDDQRFSPKIEIGDDTGFEQGLHMTCGESVKIGKGCVILPYVMITDLTHQYGDLNMNVLDQTLSTDPVEIGDGSCIGCGARIMPGVHLGKHCIVGANSVVVSGIYENYSVLAGMPAKYIKRYNTNTGNWEKTDMEGNFLE